VIVCDRCKQVTGEGQVSRFVLGLRKIVSDDPSRCDDPLRVDLCEPCRKGFLGDLASLCHYQPPAACADKPTVIEEKP
jgi:hypothetical protein